MKLSEVSFLTQPFMIVLHFALFVEPFFLQKSSEPFSVFTHYAPWVLVPVLVGLLVIQYFRHRKMDAEVQQLRRLNVAKDRFFSILGHDLKSPFNSLMGFSEMLTLHADDMDRDQVISYSHIIHQNTRRLFMLVENLLQWSRTQVGKIRYHPEKLDLNTLTGNIVNLLRLNAQEKDIVISLKMEPGLIAWGDADLLGSVIRNLLSNSIKFSSVGSVVHVSGQRLGAMNEIVFSDTGVGMSREQLAGLFLLDKPLSTPGTMNEKGTGLGLLLCKEFVEINKGRIQVNSHPGKGTQVRFTVPCFNQRENK